MRTPAARTGVAGDLPGPLHESRIAWAGSPHAARSLLFTIMGYPPPYPATWRQAAAAILSDEARYRSPW